MRSAVIEIGGLQHDLADDLARELSIALDGSASQVSIAGTLCRIVRRVNEYSENAERLDAGGNPSEADKVRREIGSVADKLEAIIGAPIYHGKND